MYTCVDGYKSIFSYINMAQLQSIWMHAKQEMRMGHNSCYRPLNTRFTMVNGGHAVIGTDKQERYKLPAEYLIRFN